MSNPIPAIALLIDCGDDLQQWLCKRFGFPEIQVTVANDLDEISSRFESTRFVFVAVNRDLLAEENGVADEILRRLSAQTPTLLIVDKNECLRDEVAAPSDRNGALLDQGQPPNDSMQPAQYLPMIEHASYNVLQQINLMINEIEIATRGNEAVGRSLDQIDSANQKLRNHIHVLRRISEPVKLNRANHRMDDLIKSTCNELNDVADIGFTFKLDFKCQQELSFDDVRVKSAIRSVFDAFNSVVEPGSTVYLTDEVKTITEELYLEIKIEATTSVWNWKPSFELALCRRIFELHGGKVDFANVGQDKFACTLNLPAPVHAKL